ncbi:hypothetical protein [Paractinoplanes durhamensis]|uniref:Uncharacterized protein n=1 Tax=Paractinoplanes durhamensis TaxID=113563 RepID=A0ABQ3ZB70_9ACTN|nr:hypothetical protein [Actinoplanes durhamensis]GIE07076.1 hypothetical protein Adu01nite_84260 [Actinoplanes durhamensis]
MRAVLAAALATGLVVAGAVTAAPPAALASPGDQTIMTLTVGGNRLGFASLTVNADGRSRRLEVCDQLATDGGEVAGQLMTPSGQIITYPDANGGGCYLRDIYYAVNWIRAVRDQYHTVWEGAPPLN